MDSFLNFFTLKKNETFNSQGKPVFKLNDLERLKRFIFLGSDNGSLYINKEVLTYDNLLCLENLLESCRYDDILDVINYYKNIVYKKDYLIYVLARCCSIRLDDDPLFWKKDFRVDCFKLVLQVCTIPTHLFLFVKLYETINSKLYNTTGWTSSIKQMISEWYQTKSYSELMYHITKYQNRYTWSHKDILRLSHIKPKDDTYNDIFRYITKGKLNEGNKCLEYLYIFEKLKQEYNIDKVTEYIQKYNFVREQIPYNLLNEQKIWVYLIPQMPITALLKNLNKITHLHILNDYPEILELIKRKIESTYVNPLQVLITLKTYKSGQGMKGGLKWEANKEIVSLLESKFYASFEKLKKTNKKILLALDVSASMSWNTVCGIDSLTAAEVSCAMTMMFDYVEKDVDIMGFSSEFKRLNISSSRCLGANLEHVKDNTFGHTDCALPFVWASENNKSYDAIIVFTDNETNCNKVDPSMALELYRNKTGIDTKLIVVGLTSNGFTIANPEDHNMMDICGFDASVYDTIREFLEM
jgi:60 kDa SS-A/Ro ribonucleoprotein